METSKLWTKDFISVFFINFLFALNYYLLMVIIVVYAMDAFGASPSEAGLAASIFLIGGLIARLFTGNRIERIGKKRLLYVGLLITLVMSLLYFAIVETIKIMLKLPCWLRNMPIKGPIAVASVVLNIK